METRHNQKKAIIIGAGPAGLTASIELQRKTRIRPLILEASAQVGGLAKTLVKNGRLIDVGPHRFFSKRHEILQWWLHFLPLESMPKSRRDPASAPEPIEGSPASFKHMLIRQRYSRILYRRKFFQYPISLSIATFYNLGFSRSLRAGIDFVLARFSSLKGRSLEDFYKKQFGTALYHMFFEKYTQKVWGMHPSALSADWGAQRVSNTSLISSLFKKPAKNLRKEDQVELSVVQLHPGAHFLYPKLGAGQMWESVAEEMQARGGEILLNHRLTEIQVENNKVVAVTAFINETKKSFSCDYVLSSMPLSELVQALRGIEVPRHIQQIALSLPYRAHITIGIIIPRLGFLNAGGPKKSKPIIRDHWIYIQEEDVKAGRIFIMNNFSPYIDNDPEELVLGVEYFCSEGDAIWNLEDEKFIEMAIAELEKLGCIKREDVIDAFQHKESKAYPSYHGGYYELSHLRTFLNSIENLYCIGRNGQHRYNNQDHSMLSALEAVRHIVAQDGRARDHIWQINTWEAYNESP